MSFIDVKTYFQDRMYAVDPDLKEWEDAFNIENIPSTILDNSWHLRYLPFNYTGAAHTCLNFNVPILLSVVLKGYRRPIEAVDTALILADSIIKEVTKPTNRLNQLNVKNVLPTTVAVREMNNSNDNIVVLEIQFTNTVIIKP